MLCAATSPHRPASSNAVLGVPKGLLLLKLQVVPWLRERWLLDVSGGRQRHDPELAAKERWGELPIFKALMKLHESVYTAVKQTYCAPELLRDPPSDEQVGVTPGRSAFL